MTLEAITDGVAPSIVLMGGPTASAPVDQPAPPSLKIALAFPLPGEEEDSLSLDAGPVVISPSIIAMGPPPQPAVSDIKTASVAPPKPKRFIQPTVIRGGIVGGLFSRSDPVASPVAPEPSQPAEKTANPGGSEPADAPPEPTTPLAPLPSQLPPMLRGPE